LEIEQRKAHGPLTVEPSVRFDFLN
jgi:hypothetical protein